MIKYYVKPNGTITKDGSKGYEEYTSPIHPDGKTILPKHKALIYDADGGITNPEVLDVIDNNKLEQDALEAKQVKAETLAKLTVTTTSGKVFYADTESRIDLQSAIASAELTGATSTMWKLAEEFNGARIVEVTLDEIKEASAKALEEKGKLVGAI